MKRLPSSTDFKDYAEEERYLKARKKVDKIKGFYGHFVAYVIVNVFLLALIYFNMDERESFWQFGHFSTAFFWGIGLFFHGMGVFGPDLFFGKNWEERKIREYMQKEERNWE